MKKIFFAAAMASMFFTACNNDIETPVQPEGDVQLQFSSVMTAALTRATVDHTVPFKINMPAVGGYTAIDGMTVTKTGDVWAPETAIYLGKTERTLTAWSPAALTPKSGTGDVFTLTPAPYAEGNDLVYEVSKTVSAAAPTVAVEFKRAYARLTFKFTADNYVDAKILESLSVAGLNDATDFNISTGVLSAATAMQAPLVLVTGGLAAFDANTAISALVVPAATATLKVTCSIGGVAFADVALASVTALEAGKNYVVTLKVKGTLMSVTSVKVNEWTDVSSTEDLN